MFRHFGTTKELKMMIVDHYINDKNIFEEIATIPLAEEMKQEYDKTINPKYHIIRTPNADRQDKVIENLNEVFGDDLEIIKYDRENKVSL